MTQHRHPEATATGPAISRPLLAVALLLWAASTFGHGLGLDLVTAFFDWARTPESLHPQGGNAGFARGELLIAVGFCLLMTAGLCVLVWQVRRLRRPLTETGRLWTACLPWIVWAALFHLTWKITILYTTELVHFAQYALIGLVLTAALNRGRRPQLAFVIAFGLGLVDEIWQHYGLHVWLMDEHTHWMDWSDPILDALGACAGILLVVTYQRLTASEAPSEFAVIRRALVVFGVLLLPLVFLDPVTTASVMGSYPYYPFWDEHVNLKAVHWLRPHEGIPFCLVAILVLGTMLEPRPRALSQRGLAILAVLLTLVVRPESRVGGREVHEIVAQTRVPHLEMLGEGAAPPTIDGSLDEPAWTHAVRLGPFVETTTGLSVALCAGPDGASASLSPTYARLLWDDQHLYVAFEVDDDDLWARDLSRDDGGIAGDEGVRLFIDDGGDEITYYEFDVNPLGRLYDAFNLIPAAPLDYEPWANQLGLAGWSASGVRVAATAVSPVDVVQGWGALADPPEPSSYTVEIAIPWETFRTTATPGSNTIRRTVQPQPGERWRLGLFRVERPRPLVADEDAGVTVDLRQATRLTGLSLDKLEDLIANGNLKPVAAGDKGLPRTMWQFSRRDVLYQRAMQCVQRQAWTPTYGDLHAPARFGVIEFAGLNGE